MSYANFQLVKEIFSIIKCIQTFFQTYIYGWTFVLRRELESLYQSKYDVDIRLKINSFISILCVVIMNILVNSSLIQLFESSVCYIEIWLLQSILKLKNSIEIGKASENHCHKFCNWKDLQLIIWNESPFCCCKKLEKRYIWSTTRYFIKKTNCFTISIQISFNI